MFERRRATLFRDRVDAGRQLAERFEATATGTGDIIVLALPRGGVPVAAEIAARWGAELDVLVARKVGAPGHREYGIGAVAEGGATVFAEEAARHVGVDRARFASLADHALQEVQRRVARYRGDRPLAPVRGRVVVVVDDGLATGVTAHAALISVRSRQPRRLLLAAPVAAADTVTRLAGLADEIVIVATPADLGAVGRWYDDFSQTTDDEVDHLLAAAAARRSAR